MASENPGTIGDALSSRVRRFRHLADMIPLGTIALLVRQFGRSDAVMRAGI
jgi:hypothetical protein